MLRRPLLQQKCEKKRKRNGEERERESTILDGVQTRFRGNGNMVLVRRYTVYAHISKTMISLHCYRRVSN